MDKGLVDTVGEGKSGTDGESSIEMYILLCVKQMTGGKLLHNPESRDCCSVTT